MFTRMKRAMKEEKGFTLIELLAVLIIIGIIAAIAVPTIGGLLTKAKDDADKATAQQLYEAARLYVTAEMGGNYTTTPIKLSELQGKKYLPSPVNDSNGNELGGDSSVTFKTDGTLDNVTLIFSDGTTKTYNGPNFTS